MQAAESRAWLTLVRAPGFGPGTAARLLGHFGDPVQALSATALQWQASGLAPALREQLHAVPGADLDGDLAWLGADARRCLLTRNDEKFPALLRSIAQSPPALFCQGDLALLALPNIAVVGARSATPQGLANARAFAADLAGRGLVVASGLALGIDAAAHEGALEAQGYTVAVCGTGLDRVYPARHRELAHRIAEHGLLLSEFPPGTPALAENFPKRNRVISGLSLGVLVVEAALGSGSLITARLAAEQGREVFAIPGSIHNPLAHGSHALIRQGAKLVEKADDILEELGPRIGAHLRERRAQQPGTTPPADPHEQAILDALGHEALGFDDLMQRSQLAREPFNSALLRLELSGQIAPAAGGAYVRIFHGTAA